MEQQNEHWSDSLRIDWTDERYKKHKHTVKIVEEGWFYTVHASGWKERESYYIKSFTANVASTDGKIGNCTCESFKTTEPTEKGKVPCKHLLVCNERRLSYREAYNAKMKDYMAEDRAGKRGAVCEHMKKAKDDPNSLFSDMDFVEKYVEGD